MTQTFREQNRDFSELLRELMLLRDHNLQFTKDLPQNRLLLFAEAAIVCVALERFLRMLLDGKASDSDTLEDLLKMAVEDKLIELPFDDQTAAARSIAKVRNTLMHGNYMQAARQLNLKTKEEYFRGPFIVEIEQLEKILEDLCKQIDPITGLPYKKAV